MDVIRPTTRLGQSRREEARGKSERSWKKKTWTSLKLNSLKQIEQRLVEGWESKSERTSSGHSEKKGLVASRVAPSPFFNRLEVAEDNLWLKNSSESEDQMAIDG